MENNNTACSGDNDKKKSWNCVEDVLQGQLNFIETDFSGYGCTQLMIENDEGIITLRRWKDLSSSNSIDCEATAFGPGPSASVGPVPGGAVPPTGGR